MGRFCHTWHYQVPNTMKDRGKYFDNEAKFWKWFSSQLRKIWYAHPTKLDFIKDNRFIRYSNGRPIYHMLCAICNKEFPYKLIEINHKVNCGCIKEPNYANKMMDVGYDDIEALCKPCHSIVTYSERKGISFEEAKLEKEVIAFSKLPSKEQKELLDSNSKAKNTSERKNEYRELLRRKNDTTT